MTIGSPSGSGATQNDIADGTNRGSARWREYFNDSLAATQPNKITITSNGVIPEFIRRGVELRSTTSGDTATLSIAGVVNKAGVGSVLIKTTYSNSSGPQEDPIWFGYVTAEDFPGEFDENQAYFNPAAGNNSGNIRVDNNASRTNGQVTLPTVENVHTYTVLIDYDGNYISQNSCGFYIDSDPRRGDTPDAEIASVPAPDASRSPGIVMDSDGNGDRSRIHHFEVGLRI